MEIICEGTRIGRLHKCILILEVNFLLFLKCRILSEYLLKLRLYLYTWFSDTIFYYLLLRKLDNTKKQKT